MPQKIYGVITADIVHSRNISGFRKERDQKLRPLSARHLRQKLVLSPYAVTAWDEFQAILAVPANIPRVILDLRRHFYPIELWIGVGIGQASEPRKTPTNVFSGGEAFERAREAVDHLKKGKHAKFRKLTRFVSDNPLFDRIANTMYNLHDTLVQKVTARQWETINLEIELGRQGRIAKRLGRHPSTISRNLERGYYWQIRETLAVMEEMIRHHFPAKTR